MDMMNQRSRPYSECHRRYYQEHKEEINEKTRDYKKDYRRKHIVMVNGKSIRVDKRPRPDDICELCDRVVVFLHYHHWDDDNPHRGIWVCHSCHKSCEFIEKGLHTEYLRLRADINGDS